MKIFDYVILGIGGVVGWILVSGLINFISQQRKPPVPMGEDVDQPRLPAPEDNDPDRP